MSSSVGILAHLENAKQALQQNNFEKMLHYTNLALSIENLNIPALLNLALIGIKFNQIAASQSLLEKIIQINPPYEEAYLLLGDIYLMTADIERAEAVYHAAIAQNFDSHQTMYRLIRLYQTSKNKTLLQKCEAFLLLLKNQSVINAQFNQHNLDEILNMLADAMNNNQWIQKYNSLPQKEQRELLDSLQRIYYANRTITAKRWVKSLSQLMQKLSGDASNLTSNAMIYDLIRFIYWGSCDNHAEMSAFDDDAVRPFVEYLESISTDFKLPQRTQFSEGPQINICYLLHQANNQGSYAIGSMIYAMLKGHALNDNPSVNIHIISLNYTNEAFVNELNQIGFSVHDLSHERNLSNKINRIYNFCETENIDICISDTNLSCPTIAYQLRVAPIQIYWITGFRYWSIPNLDYHFMPDWVDETDKFSPTSRPIKTRNPREISTVKRDFNQDIINCERNKFPLNKKLIGSYGRLVKITADYLNIIKIILEKNHDVHVLLAGTGDATLIKNFINENQLDSHITLINHFVDGFLYSRLLDIFLDTFPNIAGQAAFEAQAVKTPVIHMLSQEWGSDLAAAHRDAELIANTPDEYVNKTLALLSDNNYYQKCAEKSHEILQPYLDVKQCAAMLESNVIELTNTPLYYHSN